MPHPFGLSHLHGRSRLVAACAVAAALFAASATAASADAIREPLQPLAFLGTTVKPSCSSGVAPFAEDDMTTSATEQYGLSGRATVSPALIAEATASIKSGELLPSVTICSPTFTGIPGLITGAIASAPRLSRVGSGWRELGGTMLSPAPLTPGDVLALPEVDDATQLKVNVAAAVGQPAAAIKLTDLAPGPLTLGISRDARGLVARLTRGDGTVAEGVAAPTVVPPPTMRITGSPARWTVTTRQLAGDLTFTGFWAPYGGSTSELKRIAATGVSATTYRPKRTGRKPRAVYATVLSANRDSQTFSVSTCSARFRKAKPPRISCEGIDPWQLYYDETPFQSLFSNLASPTSAAKNLALATRSVIAKSTTKTKPPVFARRAPIRGRSASTALAAPLTARAILETPVLRGASFEHLRPLAADINGDGSPDFWTDMIPSSLDWVPLAQNVAGFVLVSSPEGLEPHRIDLPSNFDSESDNISDSEVSAIDDVTGDGIGELIVDLGERHALIPGSRTWTSSSSPIRTPDPKDLDASDVLLAPSMSSPGSPYAALDDATGDGLRELAATDDSGAWLSVGGGDLLHGKQTRLPAVTRAIPAPLLVTRSARFEPAAPMVDPRVRVIAGQAVALNWPTVASLTRPLGTVTVTVRDARGHAVRPATTVQTPGNAVLLDYDRPSGELLLLAVNAICVKARRATSKACAETMLRVRADGTIRQSLRVLPSRSILSAGAARFMTDGPDADQDVDVVTTVGNQALGLIDSTRTGPVTEQSVPIAKVKNDAAPYYQEMRPIPVVQASGARRLLVALTDPATKRYPWTAPGAVPAEISWK